MLPGRWGARVIALLERERVRTIWAVLSRYDRAGGALLAGGLAYSALFAIVPLALIVAGLTGLLVRDPATRDQVIATITDVLPPLRGLVSLVLAEAAGAAGTISIIGAATLVWGGSRFILAFEDAMVRIAGASRTRNILERNLFGLATVVVLVGVLVGSAVLAATAAFFDAAAATNGYVVVSFVTQALLVLLPLVLAIAAVAVVYRYVFETHPTWRALWRPSWVVALLLSLFARVFVFVAPRLIGAAAAIGTIATAFAALAWLGISFQALLIGAAWVSERAARESAGLATGAVRTTDSPPESGAGS